MQRSATPRSRRSSVCHDGRRPRPSRELSHFLFARQQHLERKAGPRDQVGEGDQLREDVTDRSAAGRAPPAALARGPCGQLHDPRLDRDGIHDSQRVILQERAQLSSDGREAPGLDLDQEVAAHDVDDVPVDRHLKAVSRIRVPELELCVQRLLVEKSDRVRHSCGSRGAVNTSSPGEVALSVADDWCTSSEALRHAPC